MEDRQMKWRVQAVFVRNSRKQKFNMEDDYHEP